MDGPLVRSQLIATVPKMKVIERKFYPKIYLCKSVFCM